jgi:hypothetical protein
MSTKVAKAAKAGSAEPLSKEAKATKEMLDKHVNALRNAIQRAPGAENCRLNTADIFELRNLIRIHDFTGLMAPLSKSASYDDSFILVQKPITHELAVQVCYPRTMTNNS